MAAAPDILQISCTSNRQTPPYTTPIPAPYTPSRKKIIRDIWGHLGTYVPLSRQNREDFGPFVDEEHDCRYDRRTRSQSLGPDAGRALRMARPLPDLLRPSPIPQPLRRRPRRLSRQSPNLLQRRTRPPPTAQTPQEITGPAMTQQRLPVIPITQFRAPTTDHWPLATGHQNVQ